MNRRLLGTNPYKTWILLAHRSGARLFSCTKINGPLNLVEEFHYPQGRRQNHEIDTDAKGSRYSSVAGRASYRGGHASSPSHQMKHGLDPHLEAAEHVADVFAHDLARYLHDGRTHLEYDALVLVAEPGFLGKLRGCLDKETAKYVIGTENHNLTNLSDREISERIHKLLLECQNVA